MAATLLQLLQQMARDGYGYVSVTPSAAGTTTTIISNGATSQLDPDDADTLFTSAWLKCESDSAAIPLNVGEVRRMDQETGYDASTGVLTVARAFSNASTTTQVYGLYMGAPPTTRGLDKGLDNYINATLRRLYYRRKFLLTLVTDGDMEANNVTNWSSVNVIRAKNSLAGITLGARSLRVVNSAANGYSQSATVNVEPSQNYYLSADVTMITGTGVLELYDVTNSASIATSTCAEKQTRRLYLQTTTLPSTCRKVAVRLGGQEITADGYWDNVCLMNSGAREMPLPLWFKNSKWMETLETWRAGATSSTGIDQAVDAIYRTEMLEWGIAEDRTGLVPFKVIFSPSPRLGELLVGTAICQYAELTSGTVSIDNDADGVIDADEIITDSTDADPDWVCAWSLVALGQDKKDDALVKRWLEVAQTYDRMHQAVWRGRRYRLGAF